MLLGSHPRSLVGWVSSPQRGQFQESWFVSLFHPTKANKSPLAQDILNSVTTRELSFGVSQIPLPTETASNQDGFRQGRERSGGFCTNRLFRPTRLDSTLCLFGIHFPAFFATRFGVVGKPCFWSASSPISNIPCVCACACGRRCNHMP